MKRLGTFAFAALVLFPAAALAYVSPGAATGHVNDFAGVLTAEQKSQLELQIAEYARPAGVQIAVVTVPTVGDDETVETYATKLFEEWGIGQKIADNGLLFLVAVNDREARIEVGYGLEGTVTDADSSLILRQLVLPAFKNGDYYGGIKGGVEKIEGLVDHDVDTEQYIQDEQTREAAAARRQEIINTVVWIAVLILLSWLSHKGRRGGGGFWPWIILSNIGGGRGGGFGGGGFGGFGGGRSGGGGASGKW